MATNAVNIALSDSLKAFVDERVAEGEFGTPGDYIRALIREDRERRLDRLETELLEAMETEPISISSEELRGTTLVSLLRKKLA
jgi:putative addiction module CopG family antidote